MKATRKLIPALALLLISAVLLSTATYAWFTTNTTVYATMSVQVKAPMNLEIAPDASGVAGTWQTGTLALNVSGDPQKLIPVSSNDGQNFVQCMTNKDKTVITSTIPTDGSITFAEASGNYKVQKDLWLRSETNAASVTVTLGVTDTSNSKLQGAIRVAIFEGGAPGTGTLKKILSPKTTSATGVETPSGKYILKGSGDTYTCENTTNVANEVAINLPASADGVHYYFVIWVEGNDANAVQANWVDNAFNITLTFTAA